MKKIKRYIPIDNLEVQQEFPLGKIRFYPSTYSNELKENLLATVKTKPYKQDVKESLINSFQEEYDMFVKDKAIALIEVATKLTNDSYYVDIKQSLSILYLLQKDIVGGSSIERQKFGLKQDLQSSINYVYEFDEKGKISTSWKKHGVLADWTFIKPKIEEF